jgi:hypothetical protein
MTSDKVTPDQLRRRAIVYVRQSTVIQVLHNLESQRRQYNLVEYARELGFADVVTIDEDLGKSGSGLVERPGFQRLVAEVCAGQVGAILSIEASRLARNGRDWHHLIELCGVVGVVVIDPEGIYDPRLPNDRLLLGLNRPETQSTSYSTFRWTTSFGSVVPFRTGAPAQTVPPADIPDVLTGEAPAKSAAQAGTIKRAGDFGVGAPRRHFMNPGNGFFWRFQRAFPRCSPLYVEARYGARAPTNLHLHLPRLAAPIHLHGFDRHP